MIWITLLTLQIINTDNESPPRRSKLNMDSQDEYVRHFITPNSCFILYYHHLIAFFSCSPAPFLSFSPFTDHHNCNASAHVHSPLNSVITSIDTYKDIVLYFGLYIFSIPSISTFIQGVLSSPAVPPLYSVNLHVTFNPKSFVLHCPHCNNQSYSAYYI